MNNSKKNKNIQNNFIDLHKTPPNLYDAICLRKKIAGHVLRFLFANIMIIVAYIVFTMYHMKDINAFFHSSSASQTITVFFSLIMCAALGRVDKIERKKLNEFGISDVICNRYASEAETYFIENKRKEHDIINNYCKKVAITRRWYFKEEFLKIQDFCNNEI